MSKKQCIRCKVNKPIEAFGVRSSGEHFSQCDPCREKTRINSAKRRQRLPEEKQEFYKANIVKERQKRLEYYYNNKEAIIIRQKKTTQIKWQNHLLDNCKFDDQKKGREFNLDKEWINLMLKEQLGVCYHCNVDLLLTNGERLPNQVSIDRYDNSIGHIKGNVVLSCLDCNLRKGKKSFDEFGSWENLLKP